MAGTDQRTADKVVFFIPDLCNVQAVFLLVLVAELLALVLGVSRMGLRQFSWSGFALLSLGVQWATLLAAAALCQARPLLARRPLAQAAAASYVLVLLAVATVSLTGSWLQGRLLAGQWQPDWWTLLDHLVIGAVLAGITLRYFYLTLELRLRQKAELEARVQALQSRIRPHFLFNSMNSIASLIAVDPAAAETAVEDLADLFRASLTQSSAVTSMDEEFALCRRYLRIEQLRLGERLQVRWNVDRVPETLPIPALSLQPLLENAIYHGIQQRADGGEVAIEGSYNNGEVRLRVRNPLADAGAVSRAGNRMALDNIGHRLRALYGDSAGVVTHGNATEFCAELFYRPPSSTAGGELV